MRVEGSQSRIGQLTIRHNAHAPAFPFCDFRQRSECFAGGMQSLGRVRVFGQRSMGQALPALFSRLPNGDVLIHAYGDFVTADGTRLEGRGVVPDEPVALDRRDLLAGRDRTLEAALAWFDSLPAGRMERSR